MICVHKQLFYSLYNKRKTNHYFEHLFVKLNLVWHKAHQGEL